MNIFSIIATVPVALGVASGPAQNVPVNDQNNTNTQIETQVQDQQVAQPAESEEDIESDKILDGWKEKQVQMWNSLPTDQFTITATAYTASADECGNSKGITASGTKVIENRTLACPPQFPFGAKINIDGLGTYICEDRGGAIRGNHFDIYMQTKDQAFAFGRQHLIAQVVE